MHCPERDRLWEECNRTLQKFIEQTEEVLTATPAMLSSEIISLKAAKDQCTEARTAWEAHLEMHGCEEAQPLRHNAAG